jgi:hypothetical protein
MGGVGYPPVAIDDRDRYELLLECCCPPLSNYIGRKRLGDAVALRVKTCRPHTLRHGRCHCMDMSVERVIHDEHLHGCLPGNYTGVPSVGFSFSEPTILGMPVISQMMGNSGFVTLCYIARSLL